VKTVIPAGTKVLSASSADGQYTLAATTAPLREIGWGGLTLPGQVLARSGITRLRAGQPMATVAVRGQLARRTSAVALGSVGGPSLGWRLLHLL